MWRTSVLLLLFLTACATNPVTGQRELNIVSESQEVSLGQQAHPEIIRQFGVYDEKPELTRLVQDVGRRIAATSHRPNLPWTFTILDTPMVNAMALPGGYIYVTRGMLERINSEDELAGVLGHEIAHVTARHAAQRISRAQLAQFGMVLGSVVAGPQAVQQYGQIAELAVTLLFQRYSRSQETQADLVGTEYMARSRFNPTGAERMLQTLQRLQKREMSAIERYFVSHPDPARRVRDVRSKVQEIAKTNPEALSGSLDRRSYLSLLDGVITANSTRDTVIRQGTIYDRAHGLIVTVPPGWEATTAPGMLFAMAPRGSGSAAFIAQELPADQLQGMNVQDAVRRRLQEMGLQYAGSREAAAASGERFSIDVWAGATQEGQVGVESTQFRHGDHVAVFLFVSPDLRRDRSPLGEVLQRAVVDPARARAVQPPRMRIGTVRAGESWSDLARRATGDARDAAEIANINGFDVSTPPQRGMAVKLPEAVVRSE